MNGSWWRNCALETDDEIQEIDRLEAGVSPLPAYIRRIRELISTFELCHHKAGRWIRNIIEAIGCGDTWKGLGTRLPTQRHPIETEWRNICASLSAWCDGSPVSNAVYCGHCLALLGERTPLRVWQAQRVIEKIRGYIGWPQSLLDPKTSYQWLLFRGTLSESGDACLSCCPATYGERQDFWLDTVQTIIHDRVDGCETDLSLGLAIDMLWPCHWQFTLNLAIVLGAIGGNLHPSTPFCACGRNIALFPHRSRINRISKTLQSFCGQPAPAEQIDLNLLTMLGPPSKVKRWLAASLDKTIRLQLDPPLRMRVLSSLSVPEWIKQLKPTTP